MLDIEGKVNNLQKVSSDHFRFEEEEWHTGGAGYYYPHSFRNHHYVVDVSESNTKLDFILNSAQADVAMWLYGPNGGNPITYDYGDREEFMVEDVNSGQYTIVVGTYERGTVDAFYDLDIVGKITSVNKIPSQDTIAIGNWTNGAGYSDANSLQNRVYTFEVVPNSNIDVILESNDVDVCLWLFKPNGEQIDKEYGDREEFIVSDVSQGGVYKVVVGTYEEGVTGNYKLSLVGKFTNFQKQ
ncbi:MAG: hypothetical protein IT258_16645 [Saprospiraceae bacterium]|nr:hypothetical protein [Saprospiraceae bacterium]